MTLDPIANPAGLKPAVAIDRGEALPVAPPPAIMKPAAAGRDGAAREALAPPELKHRIEKLTRALQETQSSLSFSVDEATGRTVVRVTRSSTGELVRQIPSAEALAIAASLEAGEPLGSLGLDRWS
jgi:flagellar protein FlaG